MEIHIRRAIKDDIPGIANTLIVGKRHIKAYSLTRF